MRIRRRLPIPLAVLLIIAVVALIVTLRKQAPPEPARLLPGADGFFYILDRLKDIIVTGGEKVYTAEVEAVILSNPAVSETAVYGIPDLQWGELVMASVLLKPGQSLGADELIAYCRRSLAHYKAPRRVEFWESNLPKSGSGKIVKRVLRERFWAQAQRAVN